MMYTVLVDGVVYYSAVHVAAMRRSGFWDGIALGVIMGVIIGIVGLHLVIG